MLHGLDTWLKKRTFAGLVIVCLALVGLQGLLDYLTGYELSFAIFYLIPIFVASWYAGKKLGLLISIVSVAIWMAIDITSGRAQSHWVIPLWNAGVRLGFFTIVTYLVAELASRFELEVKLASVDPLTGVMNRRAFNDQGQRLIELALRHRHYTTVVYIDIDNFKEINDRRGHGAGDQLLQTIAATLRQVVRSYDLVARIGGDEFVLLLPETDYEGARQCMVNARNHLSHFFADTGWPVTCSIGAITLQTPPATIDEAVRMADEFMYKAKRRGKNAIVHELISTAA